MSNYPEYLDGNVTRIISFIVFGIVGLSISYPSLNIAIAFLFVDFAIRYYNPQYSPLARFAKRISNDILKLKPNPQYSPPKRFAILIGFIVSGGIVTFNLVHALFISFGLKLLLLIASGLQAFVGYCVGCQVYHILSRAGIVNRSSNISSFTNKLS